MVGRVIPHSDWGGTESPLKARKGFERARGEEIRNLSEAGESTRNVGAAVGLSHSPPHCIGGLHIAMSVVVDDEIIDQTDYEEFEGVADRDVNKPEPETPEQPTKPTQPISPDWQLSNEHTFVQEHFCKVTSCTFEEVGRTTGELGFSTKTQKELARSPFNCLDSVSNQAFSFHLHQVSTVDMSLLRYVGIKA